MSGFLEMGFLPPRGMSGWVSMTPPEVVLQSDEKTLMFTFYWHGLNIHPGWINVPRYNIKEAQKLQAPPH